MSRHEEILQMGCREMCQQIQEGNMTSFELIEALQEQYKRHHQQINALAVNLLDEAVQTAKHYDSLAAKGEFIGPLHGLPVSIKENFDLKGIKTTLGVNNPHLKAATDDADVVKILKQLGAIIIGKSNVPQAMVSYDSVNPVYGQTVNPWNTEFATGGSSGGEAALLASGQSFVGIGSDLGGSIRFPSGFCGVAGFKPTTGSLPRRGMHSAIKGIQSIQGEAGPMARKVDDLHFLLEHIFDAISKSRDKQEKKLLYTDLSIPDFKIKKYAKADLHKMRIGFIKHDGFIKPAPALQRALDESIDILRQQGADLVEIPCNNQRELVHLYFSVLSADRQKTFKELIRYEKQFSKPMKPALQFVKIPKSLMPLLAIILNISKENRLALAVNALNKKTISDLWKLHDQMQQYRFEEMSTWQANELDAVITPASAMTSVARNLKGYYSLIFSYYMRYNLFGFPAGVVPICRVEKNELHYDDVNDNITRSIAASTRLSEGMPAGVQVVSLPWQDFKALQIMQILEENRKTNFQYPF